MSKDLIFRLRLDANDRERLDALAAHMSAPAATVVRMLIKERFDSLPARVDGHVLRTLARCSISGEPSQSLRVRYLDAREAAARRTQIRTYVSDRLASANADSSTLPIHGWTEKQPSEVEAAEHVAYLTLCEAAGTLEVERAPGAWGGWYLSTLLKSTWKQGDQLALDGGQDWQIVNVAEHLAEVRSFVGEDRYREFEQVALQLQREDDAAWSAAFTARKKGTEARERTPEPGTSRRSTKKITGRR